ncbi:MAG: hypothetical protein L5655_10525 [Thermosediminibacteraceae bacterium]|nr:hypothetical protein [Thermosediminibacteraceae bacterium]
MKIALLGFVFEPVPMTHRNSFDRFFKNMLDVIKMEGNLDKALVVT